MSTFLYPASAPANEQTGLHFAAAQLLTAAHGYLAAKFHTPPTTPQLKVFFSQCPGLITQALSSDFSREQAAGGVEMVQWLELGAERLVGSFVTAIVHSTEMREVSFPDVTTARKVVQVMQQSVLNRNDEYIPAGAVFFTRSEPLV